MSTVIERIEKYKDKLSSSHIQIASYIIINYKEVVFMNSVELSKKVGISNPTIIRFATALGYSGYNDMKRHLQQQVQNELSLLERFHIEIESDLNIEKHRATNNTTPLISKIINTEIENMCNMISCLETNNLNNVVKLISSKKYVYIAGSQISYSLANYAHYSLSKIKNNVMQVTTWNKELFDHVKQNGSKAVGIIFALPRYPKATLKIMEEFKRRNIQMIIITDSLLFSYSSMAQNIFLLPLKYFSFLGPLSSCLCLINVILAHLEEFTHDISQKNLKTFEDFVTTNEIYYKK